MVRAALLASLAQASGHLIDIIVPPSVLPDRNTDPRWEPLRDVWDIVLRNAGYDEERLRDIPFVYKRCQVPMRDNVTLDTMVVNIPDFKKGPAIVSRSPYGILGSDAVALVFTVLNGYTAVIQSQRGTHDSTGVYDMWSSEGQDSTDVAEWVAQQSWSNGEVYYAGASADGMPGNMAVTADPARLRGEWLIWTAENGHRFAYPQGAYRQDLMRGYLTFEASDTHGASRDLVLPKVEQKEAYDEWWDRVTVCPGDAPDPSSSCVYDRISWPVVDSVGWWDLFQHTHLRHWQGIRSFSDPSVRDQHVLVVGPLGHCIGGAPLLDQPIFAAEEANGLVVAAEVAAELFAGKLDGPVRSKLGRVNLFVMGSFHLDGVVSAGNYWTSLDDFPNPEPTTYFLKSGGGLSKLPPLETAALDYVYDPSADGGATPMLGGNNLPGFGDIAACGTADQISKANRSDVLVFDSPLLLKDTAIAGQLSATLHVSSTAKDTDFFVSVEDLGPLKEQSMLVRYGAIRMRWRDGQEDVASPAMEAGKVYKVTLDLWSTAYVFPKGHHIRVTVSSAAYPYYSLNLNSGNAPFAPDDVAISATNTIHLSPLHPSSVSLPVLPLEDLPKNAAFVPSILPQGRSTVVV
jgi:putative CocE/NonD family hydrolase